jgi:hypothetical protein
VSTCALALLAFAPAADKVAFAPKDGSEASKTFSLSGTFELGDISLVADGQDMSGQLPFGDLSGEFDLNFDVVDHYVKSADGKPLHLERAYGKSTASFDAMQNSQTKEDLFEVDGKTVVFKWDAEKGEYTRSLKDGEGDPKVLDEIGVDLDYRGLLPEQGVSAGDKWEIEPKKLMTALFFGAEMKDLSDLSVENEELAEIADELVAAAERLFESFKAQCEYVGARDEDGTQVGQIKVALDSKGTADLSEMIRTLIEKQTEGAGISFDIGVADLGLEIKGDGMLLWNLADGRVHSFSMDSDVELTFELDASMSDPNGGEHSAEVSMEMLGTVKWGME